MPAREIPGFIYDEERGRYFPITSINQTPPATRYNRENIKRRKTDHRRTIELDILRKQRSELYHEYWSQISDPYVKAFGPRTAFNFIGGIERERYGYDEVNQSSCSNPIHLDFKDSRIISYNSHEELTNLLIATKDMLLRLPVNGSDSHTLMRIYNSRNLDGQSPGLLPWSGAVLKRIDFDNDNGEAFVHIELTETNAHYFGVEQLWLRQNTPSWCRMEFQSYENIHDSVNMGKNFIIAFNNKIAIIPWNLSSPRTTKILDKKNKSDILSLAVSDSHSNPKFLYAGYRDGSLYAVPFHEGINGEFDFRSMKKMKFHHIKLIISIKPFKDHGFILISGITDRNSQALFVLDVLISPCQIILELRTSFCNLTRDKEIFEITPDGHYICYGTRDREGDFELFSTHRGDNLVTESSNPVIYYPLLSKSNKLFAETKYTHIRTAGFGRYIHSITQQSRTVLFVAMETERKASGTSSIIFSIEL